MTENAIVALAVSAPFVALFLAIGAGDIGTPAAEAVKDRARADVEIERLRLEAERLRLVYARAADGAGRARGTARRRAGRCGRGGG